MSFLSLSRKTSAGCLIGFVAMLSSLFPFFGAWGLWKWFNIAAEDRHYNTYFWVMVVALLGGGLMTVLIVYTAYPAAGKMGGGDYDLDDLGDL